MNNASAVYVLKLLVICEVGSTNPAGRRLVSRGSTALMQVSNHGVVR
jgi:hypothetical protein